MVDIDDIGQNTYFCAMSVDDSMTLLGNCDLLWRKRLCKISWKLGIKGLHFFFVHFDMIAFGCNILFLCLLFLIFCPSRLSLGQWMMEIMGRAVSKWRIEDDLNWVQFRFSSPLHRPHVPGPKFSSAQLVGNLCAFYHSLEKILSTWKNT